MLVIYLGLLYLILGLTNIYVVWLLMELIFLFFLLIIINFENKRVGLIIYFFFQSTISLILFLRIFFCLDKMVFLLLLAKLGVFPFFYWIVVVRIKVGLLGNMFVLSLQKFRVLWLFWLYIKVSLVFLYFIVYLRVLFVVLILLMVSDLWLLLVYSSIANTRMLLIRVTGEKFFFSVFLYLFVVLIILFLIKLLDSYMEIMFMLFMFLVIPPFVLFFIKFYVILSLGFLLKLGFFLAFLDVFILLYYFRLIFIKFMLIDTGILIYFMNMLVCFCLILFRNCVAMIIFYKS